MKNKAEIQKLAEALRKEIGDYSQLSVALETLVPNGAIDYDNEGQVIFYTDFYPGCDAGVVGSLELERGVE